MKPFIHIHAHLILILINTYYVLNFDSLKLNIYTQYKISLIRVWTLKFSLKNCEFALLAVLSFLHIRVCVSFLLSKSKSKCMNLNEVAYESNIFRMVWVWCQCHKSIIMTWISIVDLLLFKISWVLMSSEKIIHCRFVILS